MRSRSKGKGQKAKVALIVLVVFPLTFALLPLTFNVPLAAQLPDVLSPARSGLLPVPTPQLDALELSVAEQMRELHASFADLVARTEVAEKDLAEAYGLLGQLYHAYEFFDAAEASYANATRLAPGDVRWLHLAGYLYQQTGRLEEAVDRFVAARRVQPDDRAATVRLGEVYVGLNRLREARDEFQKVVTTFPGVAHHGLGEVALREGRFEEAIAHFKLARERVPQATAIHYSLAMAYRGLGRLDEARSHLRQRGPGGIRAVDPIVDGLRTLVRGERALVIHGRRAYEAGQFQDAADAFSKAVSAAPGSATARVNLGLAQSQLGSSAAAAEQFEAALRLDAGNVTAHASLGIMLARQGRDRDGVDHLRAAFEQVPDDANVSHELIGALLRLGRDDDAITVLAGARSFHPDDEATLVNLSILLADRQRYSEAVALLDEANRRFPERTTTATTLARLLASSPDLSLRDGRRALELAMAVYASQPAPVHGETVALSLAELGRCDEAAEWMRRAVTEAEQAKDTEETARLRSETPKYEIVPCRAPAQ